MADEHRPSPTNERLASIPWDRPDHLVTLDIAETARRAGHQRWLSARLFELLGSWVAIVPEVDVKQRLAEHAHRVAWHDDLWRDRLPEVAEMPPIDLTVAPNDGMRAAVEEVARQLDPGLTIERLVGAYRVLVPRLVAASRYQQAHTSQLTDAPTTRVLSLVLADLTAIWIDGEMLIQSMIHSPEDARRAASFQERVEGLVARAGGVCGHGTIG